MRFDIAQYQGEVAMHCRTREEAQVFLEFLHRSGKSWCNGDSYNRYLYYDDHKEQTVYSFNNGKYGDLDWYIEHGYYILEFKDFEWDNGDISLSANDIKQCDKFLSQFVLN